MESPDGEVSDYAFERSGTEDDLGHTVIIIKSFMYKSLLLFFILTISMITTGLVVGSYLIITYLLSGLANSLGLSQDAALLTINTISQAQFAITFAIITIITTITTIKLIRKEAS